MGISKYPQNYVPLGSYLTFIRQLDDVPNPGLKKEKPRGLYKCKCGKEVTVTLNNAKSGGVKSCGCIWFDRPGNVTHGLHDHPLYRVWQGIKSRCYKSYDTHYSQYGGRGVVMCDEWINHPEKFIAWALEKGWKKGLQVDKDVIPKALGIPAILYSPEMCSLVTSKANNNARSNNRLVTYNGETKSVTEWSRLLGIGMPVLYKRLFVDGWSPEKAFNTPLYLSRFRFKNKQE